MLSTTATQPRPPETASPSDQLLTQLGRVCESRGLPNLADRLVDFQAWIADDLRGFETELKRVDRGPRAVQRAAHHLLDLGGKHLRPMCVALAAKAGSGFGPGARKIAVAVELVHTATLLHDDVVDAGDRRRGEPAARCIYGNAASVFAGDWLLVQSLMRVRESGVDEALERLLAVIDEMILAESLQLEQRGRIHADIDDYFRVVEGKTAALFRWAMWAGARAGGLTRVRAAALEEFGQHLGVAFQIVDDYLDFGGDSAVTGKSLFTDLREGKMTYPLLVAMSRDDALRAVLEDHVAAGGDADLPAGARAVVAASLERTGALADSRALARERIARGIACLDALDDGPARTALITVAEATALRER